MAFPANNQWPVLGGMKCQNRIETVRVRPRGLNGLILWICKCCLSNRPMDSVIWGVILHLRAELCCSAAANIHGGLNSPSDTASPASIAIAREIILD